MFFSSWMVFCVMEAMQKRFEYQVAREHLKEMELPERKTCPLLLVRALLKPAPVLLVSHMPMQGDGWESVLLP